MYGTIPIENTHISSPLKPDNPVLDVRKWHEATTCRKEHDNVRRTH